MAIFTAALACFLQADGGAGTGAPTSLGFGELARMMTHIGPVAIFVLVLLLLASLYSWMVILGKISTFSKATTQSRKFIRAFRKATRLNEIAALTSDYSASPLAQVFEDVYETYKRQTGGSGPPRNLTPLERTAQTSASTAITALERRMTWLATIGATSPVCWLVRYGDGGRGCVQGLGTAGAATSARGGAGNHRGADYNGSGLVRGRTRGGCVQPIFCADQVICFGDRRFLPRTAEFT